MNISIIFHSLCGNTYLMTKAFHESFLAKGHKAAVYRLADDDWTEQPDISKITKEHFKKMFNLPVASPEILLDCDLVVLGCPTYFGNVSAEMKAFMDATSVYWFEAKLAGKKLAAFTSVGSPDCGANLCLQAIQIYGQHMGMISIPLPANLLSGESCPAYGVIHYSEAKYGESLDEKVLKTIDRYVDVLLKHAV